jgi:hypothetical protein
METMAVDNCNLYQVLDARQPEFCPYHDLSSNICEASLSSITVDRVRCAGYCSTDNFDNCALFLSKTLRKK